MSEAAPVTTARYKPGPWVGMAAAGMWVGQQGSVASDLFSLGATLWHLLAGRSPFDVPGQNSLEELEARIADPRPPSIGRPDVPQKLEQLLSRMMAKQPHRRPRSAAEVVAVLTSVEQQIGAPQPDEPWHTIRPVTGSHVNGSVATVKDELAHTVLRASAGHSLPIGLPARTMLKPREVIEQQQPIAAPQPAQGRARWAWIAGTVVLVLAIGGLLITRPWQQKAPQRHSNVDRVVQVGSGAGGQGDDLPPGEPEITATRVDPQTLRFTWTYSARLESDTFLWRTTNAAQPQAVSQPSVDIKSPAGTRVCVVVKVVRADGSYGTVAWSDEGCGG